MTRIEMVISDFGGVLTTPLAESFIAMQEKVGIPPRAFGLAMQDAHAETGVHPLHELECGRITEREFSDQLSRALEPHVGHRPVIEEFGPTFFQALNPNPGMLDLIREVRRDGYRTALLTNNVREWEPQWRSMIPVDELFEEVVDSAFVGCRKPDPRIYEITLERVGLAPEACLFIDDVEINCEGASALGIRTVHFRETAQARADVRALLNP
ncbi:MAG: HAD family phosphatase [Solirubrobacterales bacterium]|nr:HAD family phosphatase [Solirubrobacterales bacterium]